MKSWNEFATVTVEHESERTLVAALWAATRRYSLAPAPNGLALVQDFLNTRASAEHGPDLLGDWHQAQSWVSIAVWGWSRLSGREYRAPTLNDVDALRLRQLRDTLDAGFNASSDAHGPGLNATVDFALRGAEVSWMPSGVGWRWLYAVIMGEVLISQLTGIWNRVKQCRNQDCRATFFDRTWNNREVLHDDRTCQRPELHVAPRPAGAHRDNAQPPHAASVELKVIADSIRWRRCSDDRP